MGDSARSISEATWRKMRRVHRWLGLLPMGLRRIRIARLLSWLAGSKLQVVHFQRGVLVGNVTDDWVANSLVRGAFADYGYFALAGALLEPGWRHVDVGANYGFHTFGLVREWQGQGLGFVMFEANPRCCEALRLSMELHPAADLKLVEGAVGQEEGFAKLIFEARQTGGGHLATDWVGEGGSVRERKLDDCIADKSRPTLVKMDIEGSELRALRGAAELLKSGCVKYIYFEVNVRALAEQNASFAEVQRVLEAADYSLWWPHSDVEWIGQTYGDGLPVEKAAARALGKKGWMVLPFDPARFQAERFGQCDLLAVHRSAWK